MRRSLVLLVLLIIKLCDATIKVNFTHDEFNQYTASIAGQEYLADERATKVFGKHPPGQKSSDVKVIDCAEKGNNFEIYPPMLSSIFGEAEVLLLQNSRIKKLAYESFVHTQKVKIMMFAKDNFVIEPAVFRDCKELEVLKFDDLDLSNVNVEAFEGIETLKILSIKNCEISRMEPQLLEPLENLMELHITQNPMRVPPISAIQRMTHLRVLNLSGNKLTHLHDDLFKNKQFLEFVDVSKNIIHEVERDILLHWPGHATINMEGNNCIDRKFDHIGTDSLTLSDVANALMPCFGDNEEFTVEVTSSSTSGEYSAEKSKENDSRESIEKSEETREVSASKSSESSKEKRSKILEKLMKVSKSESTEGKKHEGVHDHEQPHKHESKSNERTEEKKFETIKNKSSSSSEEIGKKAAEHMGDKIKITESKESKSSESAEIQTVKNSKESSEIQKVKNSKESTEIKEKISKENFSKEKITNESESIEKILEDEKLTEKEKEEKIEGKIEAKIEDDPDVEVVATISPFEFIEQEESSDVVDSTLKPDEEFLEIEENEDEEKLTPESEGEKVEETTEKKRKIKIKKIKKTTTEAPETATEKFSELPEPATNFLHPYEMAYCRFFIDADNKYNCVLENVTSEIKLIKTEHLNGYDNSNVAGLFLRQSVLVRLPLIFFDTFENLEHLSVENTNIKQLDEDTVKDGCGKLKTISLKNNKIRRLERHALKECENLEEIDLTGNPLEYLEGDIFNYNPKLSIQMGSLKIVAPALTSF